jgi:opacity protein-like surface antigen
MKKCFIVALSLLSVVPSVAQDEEKPGFLLFGLKTRIGLNVGVNFSTASLEPESAFGLGGTATKSGRTDIIIGIPFELQVVPPFALRVEPTYTQYGYTVEQGGLAGSTTKTKKTYLEFPITGQYSFCEGPLSPFGFFGFGLGFMFCSQEEFIYNFGGLGGELDAPTSPTIDPIVSDVRDQTSKVNFALAFGGGVEYELSSIVSLMGDIRYTLGLTNTSKVKQTAAVPPVNQVEPVTKLRGFQIRVGGMYAL